MVGSAKNALSRYEDLAAALEHFNQETDCILKKLAYGLYEIPVFTEEFCGKLVEELANFEESGCPRGRPNSMNNSGSIFSTLYFLTQILTTK